MTKHMLAALAATHFVVLALPALAGASASPPPLLQSWSDPGLITVDDNWSGVPALVGHRGDGLTSSAGADPRTVVADGGATPVDVTANRTDPGAVGLAAGVAEFELEDPVVAIQGSAVAGAPHLLLSLDTRGLTGVSVRMLLRDVDPSSTGDAAQAVAVQYRVGSAGDFVNAPGGYVADATTGPSQATLATPLRITLPAAADDQPLVQVRVLTTNAAGQDEWVGVDDIEATAAGTIGGGCPPPPPGGTPPGPAPVPPAPGPIPPPGPAPVPPPAGDLPPALSGLEIEPAAFPAAQRGPVLSRRGRAGAALRFFLTKPATVRFEVVPAPGPAAWRKRLALRGSASLRFSTRARRGVNRLRFSGRIHGRALPPGGYRLLATAVDRAGRRSTTVTADFRIRRRGAP